MQPGTYHYSNGKTLSLVANIGILSADELLSHKTILITGGSSGIGLAIAKKCAAHGAKILITGRNQHKLEMAQKEIGNMCYPICFDVKNISKHSALIECAAKKWGFVNCIVHSAGVSLHEGDLLNVSERSWNDQMDTNLKAPFFLTQAWLRFYYKNNMKDGRILFIASDTSAMGSTIPYGLSKAGIASFVCGLSKHVITKGIRINAIAPGTTKTVMTDSFTHGEVCRSTTAGKRVLFPEEIAETAVFLLSDLSTCISGQIIGCTEANICFDNSYREHETNP